MPKLAQLVEARLRAWFEARCVAPRRQQIAVPSLWPRMHNVVVEGDAGGAAAEEGTAATAEEKEEEDEEAGAGPAVRGVSVPWTAGTAGLAAAGAGLGIGAVPLARLDAEALARHQAQQDQLHGGWAGLRFRGGVGTGMGGGEGGRGGGFADDEVGGMPGGFA